MLLTICRQWFGCEHFGESVDLYREGTWEVAVMCEK